MDALRRRWDVLPEVYAAINANRADRVGTNATFTEIAWVLASLTEVRSTSHWSPYDRVGAVNADP